MDKAYLAALLEEKAQCERADKKDRLKAIEAELKRIGYRAAKPQERAEKRPAKSQKAER
jgi:hypothetical protein